MQVWPYVSSIIFSLFCLCLLLSLWRNTELECMFVLFNSPVLCNFYVCLNQDFGHLKSNNILLIRMVQENKCIDMEDTKCTTVYEEQCKSGTEKKCSTVYDTVTKRFFRA